MHPFTLTSVSIQTSFLKVGGHLVRKLLGVDEQLVKVVSHVLFLVVPAGAKRAVLQCFRRARYALRLPTIV